MNQTINIFNDFDILFSYFDVNYLTGIFVLFSLSIIMLFPIYLLSSFVKGLQKSGKAVGAATIAGTIGSFASGATDAENMGKKRVNI